MTATMTGISVFSYLLAICIACASAGTSCTRDEMARENLQKLALANNELALNLHRKLVAGSSENVFFSPLSVSSAFAMLFYGTEGDTAQELRQALGYEKADILDDVVHDTFGRYLSDRPERDDPSEGYVLKAANVLIADKHLELTNDYKAEVEDLYKAPVREVDFMAEAPKVVREVNAWVKLMTSGKIKKLLDELSPSTVLVLLNAVYFKGTWQTRFEKKHTMGRVFYNNGFDSQKVQLMHLISQFPYASVEDFQALELPYKGKNVSMVVLLPNQRDGLKALENSLTPEKLTKVLGQLSKTKVEVSLPKFKLQFEKELSPEMKALGAKQIFSPGSANFSGMAGNRNVFVSQVLHKAVVEVNEEGSEAAAVTGVVSNRMVPMLDSTKQFKADHPFLFAIVEKGSKSNMILFLGSVNKL